MPTKATICSNALLSIDTMISQLVHLRSQFVQLMDDAGKVKEDDTDCVATRALQKFDKNLRRRNERKNSNS